MAKLPFLMLDQLSAVDLLLLILAGYRLTRMAWAEEGPFGVALWIRSFLVKRTQPDSFVQRGLECPFCLSFWIVLALLVVPLPVAQVLGIMGGVAIIFDWVMHD